MVPINKISILIVDDQNLMREGLQTILSLEDDFEIVATARDGQEGLELARQHKPQVILMDIRMPRMDGVECTRRVLAEFPDCKVIILTTFDEEEYVLEALRHGASGYLLKDVPSDVLASSIRDACKGVVLLQPEIAAKLVASANNHRRTQDSVPKSPALTPDATATGFTDLLPREIELLKLLSRGMSNKEIASRLHITEGTVKNYLSVVYEKLGVKDRTQAVLLYTRAHDQSNT